MDRNDDADSTNEDLGPKEQAVPPAAKRIQVTDSFPEASSPEKPVIPEEETFNRSTPRSTGRLEIKPRTDNIEVAPEPTAMEDTMLETESEPTTTTETTQPEPAMNSDQAIPTTPESTETQVPGAEPDSAPAIGLTAAQQSKKKRRFISLIALGVLLLVLAGAAAWWLLAGSKQDNSAQVEDTSSLPVAQPKLGVAITVADGTVEHMRGEGEWQPANADTQLQEGDSVRTGADSRSVLTLDDGSAVRIDANTTILLESLSVDNIVIRQIDGTVYSRVVPSDRHYTVAIGETAYQALGTAFITFNDQTEKGVQVYQSSVKVNNSADVVAEGNQYYEINDDSNLQGKVTAISIDKLVDDSFVNWNLSQDEKDKDFKKKLGLLSKIKQRSEELEKERQDEEKRRLLAEKEAIEKRLADEKKQSEAMGDNVTRGDMILSLNGKTFNWLYTGKAVHGYLLVYSKSSDTPTVSESDSIYFGINETSGSLIGNDDISRGKYSVRVCAYTDTFESDPCVDYSNPVIVRL